MEMVQEIDRCGRVSCFCAALSDLFAHYMEAWKSWYAEVAQGAQGKSLSQKAIYLPR